MRLRAAQPPDAAAVADVHVRSWQVGYRGLLSDAYLDSLRTEDRARRYAFGGSPAPEQPATIVAVEQERICGFATIAAAREADRRGCGELCALYVDPERWGCGIGRALIQAARGGLARRGFQEGCLWVLAGNERAGRFYELDGWSPDGSRRVKEVWGVAVDEIRYRRSLP